MLFPATSLPNIPGNFHFNVYSYSISSWEMREDKYGRERTGRAIKVRHIVGMKGARKENHKVLCVCSRLKYWLQSHILKVRQRE